MKSDLNYKASIFPRWIQMFKDYFPLIQCIICFSIAVVLQSRAFVLGYLAAICFTYMLHKNVKLNFKKIVLIIFLALLVILLFVFAFKTDSSLGRIFVYKISLKVLHDYFPAGIGLGKFDVVYRQYQAEYFREGHYTIKELLLADNTTYAFNDYLQFVIETGLTGLMLLILGSAILILIIKNAIKQNLSRPSLLLIAVSQIIAISTAAVFTHVFEKILFQCVFITSFFIVFYYSKLLKFSIHKYVLVALLSNIIILWTSLGYFIKNHDYYNKYTKAKELLQTGYVREASDSFRVLFPRLKDDISFSYNYSNALIIAGDFSGAAHILEKLLPMDNSYFFYQKLGDCYFRLGKLKQAEDAYLTSIYMVPNRLKTRLALFEFYRSTNQTEKAITIARLTLTLPVKIPSVQASNIKQIIQTDLNKMLTR